MDPKFHKEKLTTNFVPLPRQLAYFNRTSLPKGDMVSHQSDIEPRREGKTSKWVNTLIDRAYTKFVHTDLDELRYGYASPTLKQSKTNVWDEFKRRLSHLPGYTPNENLTTITMKIPVSHTRTRMIKFYVWGLERPGNIKGGFLDGLVLDEYAQIPAWIYKDVFQGMLIDPYHKGWCARTGTVRGKNHFFEHHKMCLEEMQGGNPNFFAYLTRTSITKHISPEEIKEIQMLMGMEYYLQEFECIFGVRGTDRYFLEHMDRADQSGRIALVPHDPNKPVYVAWDIGGASKKTDTTALWYVQKSYDGAPRIIDYSEHQEMPTKEIGVEIKASRPEYDYGGQILPWDAHAFKSSTTPKTELEEVHGLGDIIVLDRVKKITRINKARTFLSSCFIDRDKCNLGIIALREYSKKWDQEANLFVDDPKHDRHSHGADAFTHLALGWEQIEEFSGDFMRGGSMYASSYTP